MQRLIYENLLGERVTLGGEAPYVLSGVSGVGATGAERIATRGARQNGATTRRMTRLERRVKARISIWGAKTRGEMYAARRELERMLALPRCFDAHSGSMGRLIYENDAGRYWTYAVPEEAATDGVRWANALSAVTVAFACDSPYWNEFAMQTQVLRMGDEGFSLPFALPFRLGRTEFSAECENAGAIDAPVCIVVEGSGETPEIRNETTGTALRIDRAVASGERLVIQTDPDTLCATIEHADGTSESAFGYLDAQCPVTAFVLRPGRNTLRYVPGKTADHSCVTLTWRTRHEGV